MAGPSRRVDLNEWAQQSDRKVDFRITSIETPEELRSRLQREEAAARHERFKDLVILVAVLLGVAVMMAFGLRIAADSNSSPDDKKWATALLTSIVSAGLGFLTGKATKSN